MKPTFSETERDSVLSTADLLVRLIAELRTKSTCPSGAVVKTTATDDQKQRAKSAFNRWFEESLRLTDEALDCCDVLLAFAGSGIGTGMRDWIRLCTTPHGREHNPWDDELLATVIEEAQAIARLARFTPPPPPVPGQRPETLQNSGRHDLVSLDEAAALVHRSKRTLERRLRDLPAPHVQGGGGKASLWKWDALRPWLEREYVPDLPKRFPRNVR